MFEQSTREFLGLKGTLPEVKNASNVIEEGKFKTVKQKESVKIAKCNPLKFITVDRNQEISQINSHSLEETSNDIDNYYEADHYSEGISAFSPIRSTGEKFWQADHRNRSRRIAHAMDNPSSNFRSSDDHL